MSGRVVDMNRERWLALANGAMNAVGHGTGARELGAAAGRMVTATPPATAKYAMALCTAFRWACQAYAFGTEAQRKTLRQGLFDQAAAVRSLFAHVPPPREAAAQAAPVPPPEQTSLDLPDHPWMSRRDIGGV